MLWFCFVFRRLVYPMLTCSLSGLSILTAPSVFSKDYLGIRKIYWNNALFPRCGLQLLRKWQSIIVPNASNTQLVLEFLRKGVPRVFRMSCLLVDGRRISVGSDTQVCPWVVVGLFHAKDLSPMFPVAIKPSDRWPITEPHTCMLVNLVWWSYYVLGAGDSI